MNLVRTPRLVVALSVLVATLVAIATTAAAQRTQKPLGAFSIPQTKFAGLGDSRFLPSDVTRRQVQDPSDKPGKTRRQIGGPNGANVIEQVVDAFPTPTIDQRTPFVTDDEQFIYYAGASATSRVNQVYRLSAGSVNNPSSPGTAVPVAVTAEPGIDHQFPVTNSAGNRIVFSKSSDGVPADSPTKVWHLFASNLPPTGTISATEPGTTNLISLSLGRTFKGKSFTSVGRACWIGTNDILFSGKLVGDANFHLFSVNTTTLTIFQVTAGVADERNPVVSPDGRHVAFDSTALPAAVGSSYTGGTMPASESQAGDPSTAGAANPSGKRNIFTSGLFGEAVRQFTSRYASAPDTSNVQPSWSSLKSNPFSNANGQTIYITWASTRQPDVASSPTTFTDGDTHDIYMLRASTDAGATILSEQTPISTQGARVINTADPTFAFDDTHPVWSPVLSVNRVAFQSDRTGNLAVNNFGEGFTSTPGTRDIFLASAVDFSAPTLIRYDTNQTSGEVVHINLGNTYNPNTSIRTRDQGLLPGSDVFVTVRADDRESGVKAVYAQFKNPNSYFQAQTQGGTAREHKEFRTVGATKFVFVENNAALFWTNVTNGSSVGSEYEAEAITLDGSSYVKHSNNGGALYEAGDDDQAAFSGSRFPALNGQNGRPNCWLELKPLVDIDGNPIMPADGRGGILFGATWKLPAEASDWYVDVIMYDNAASPFSTGGTSNWIIYDNVWGFSTALPLTAAEKDILFVSDYTLGQKFFLSRSGGVVGGPQNRIPIQFGAESYLTDSDMGRYPSEQFGQKAPPAPGGTVLRNWATTGPFFKTSSGPSGFFRGQGGTVLNPGYPHALGVGSYVDELLSFQTRRASNGQTYALPDQGRYSIWRILSRGAVPNEILQAYLPVVGTQPADVRAGEKTVRSSRIYNRLVVWSSPFTGNLFVGPGTVTDLKTQQSLSAYVASGGRLLISGQDIGFALAGNGQSNDFFTNTLKASFLADNSAATSLTSAAPTALTHDSWGTSGLQSAYGETTDGQSWAYSPLDSRPLLLNTYFSNTGVGDASRTSDPTGLAKMDVIAPLAGAIAEFSYNSGGAGIISSKNTNGGAVIYASFGIESISQDWYLWTLSGTDQVQVANRGQRAKLITNFSMGYRTGTLTGRFIDEQGSPVSDALVRAVSGAETAPAAGTAITDGNGFFQIDGIDGGAYAIYGYKAGYYTQHTSGQGVHGTGRRSISLVLKRANPGKLTSITTVAPTPGGVLGLDKVTPIAGIEVQARRINPDGKVAVFTAISNNTSDARIPGGSYELKDLLIGEYEILCNAPDTYDVDGILVPNPNFNSSFGTVIVKSVAQPNQFKLGPLTTITQVNGRDVLTVVEDKNPQIDFYLPSAPQAVSGKVINRVTGSAIAGAFVSAMSVATNAVVATATTDSDGRYTLTTTTTPSSTLIAPGGYTLTGTALGFAAGTVSASVQGSSPIVAPDIALVPQLPGSLSGKVVGILGNAIDGAVVKLFLDRGGVVESTPTYTVTTTAMTSVAGYNSNYSISSVSPGKYVVVVEKDGLVSDPVQLLATVVTVVETKSVNFRLLPPRVYGDGLQLVSVPYQYSGTPSTDIFGLSMSGDNDGNGIAGTREDISIFNAFNIADWTGVEYNTGATVPLNTGKGYFVKFGAITSVAKTGTAIPGNQFIVSLAGGWNLIGHPFTNPTNPSAPGQDLDLYQNASIQDASGNTYTMSNAVQLGLVSGVLFGYTGSNSGGQYFETSIMKPWAGYWFRVNMDNPGLKLVLTYPSSRGVRLVQSKTVTREEMNAPVTRKIESKSISDWRLQLAAFQGKLRDTDNTIGVTNGGSAEFDNRFDNVKPPMVSGAHSVYLSVESTIGGRSVGLADSLVGARDTHRWIVNVKTSQNGVVSLQWPSAGQLPRNLDVFVTDIVTGKSISVRSAGSYQFDGIAGGTRRFSFEAKMQSTGTLAVSNVRTISGASRSAGYRIGITTTVTTDIVVNIESVSGRVVRTLQTRSAGMKESTVAWDGRDGNGRDIPAGAYMVVIRATDSQGRVVTHRVPMTTIR